MAEVESVVQPNRVADDFSREPMAFVYVRPPILSISASLLVSTRGSAIPVTIRGGKPLSQKGFCHLRLTNACDHQPV